mgnify:CR=1 FL=1
MTNAGKSHPRVRVAAIVVDDGRLLLVRCFGHADQVPVAARPVRAAESGIGQADVSAESDDDEGEQGGSE